MASISMSGTTIEKYCPFYTDGGLLTSAFIKDGHVVAAKIASNAVEAAKLNYETITGVASAGTPVSAAHTLGVAPSLVIPTCRTSGGSIATTGVHTSAAILGIVSDISGGAGFIIYIFG